MKTTNSSVDEFKEKVKNKTLELGLYSGKNGQGQDITVIIDVDKFVIYTKQNNGWSRVNIYEYDREEDIWVEEETYEKEQE